MDAKVQAWLMEGDPAIRWQVQRDLLGEKASGYEKERAKVAREGWGARLLALQARDGSWGGGDYSPKFTSTHYTLLTLKRLGLEPEHPRALKACKRLIESPLLFNMGAGFPTRRRAEPDICVLGMKLSMLAYFGYEDARVHRLAGYVLEKQMADSGWNCRHWHGDVHSSFHSTLSVLEGLFEYQRAYPRSKLPLAEAQAAGREFLLVHYLYKSHRTGKVFDEKMLRFPFPPQWRYDVLKCLDHFQATRAPRDERTKDAVDLLRRQQDGEGRWKQYEGQAGKYHFKMEATGKPSRGNTLRALRVLKWWEG